jgi:acetyl esterase/lipase
MAEQTIHRMNRRQLLKVAAGGALAAAVPGTARAQLPGPTTHLFKTVGGCQIKADVYASAQGGHKPAVMWIHGGALIMGSRKWPDARFCGELLQRGFVVVSIDYRLAPETKLPGIIEDVQDAWRWVREEGPKRFGIDPERMATAGGSAGGYLTLMTGFCMEPRPRALVSYFGYGDITTPWYSKPDAFYRRQPLVPKEEAYRCVGSRELAEPPGPNQRGRFYLYCRQQGIWPNEVAGHDPHREAQWFDPYCPVRNVTAKYPPTYLIHGTEDTDVPYAESKNMAAKLAAAGVAHEFITVAGAGHGLSGAKPDKVAQIARQAAEYIKTHTS